MTPARQGVVAMGAGLVAGLVVAVCTVMLIADHVATVRRAPDDKIRVEALRERIAIDAGVAAPLHEERERQTAVSLERKARNRQIAWILLLAGSICVACGKWYMAHRPQPLPTLDALVDARFAPASNTHGARAVPAAASHTTEPAAADPSFVDAVVERFGAHREAAIPILQAIQAHCGYLPDEALQYLCQVTQITPAQIAGNSSFYAQFRRSPVGRHVVRVCHGTACHVAGAQHITQELRRHLDIPADGDTDAERLFTIDAVACLGCCSLAPVMMIDEGTAGHLTPASARQALEAMRPSP